MTDKLNMPHMIVAWPNENTMSEGRWMHAFALYEISGPYANYTLSELVRADSPKPADTTPAGQVPQDVVEQMAKALEETRRAIANAASNGFVSEDLVTKVFVSNANISQALAAYEPYRKAVK